MHTPSRSFDLNAAPMRIGKVRLKVRDLAHVADFYRTVLGLERLGDDGGAITLGVATTPLVELIGDPAFTRRDPRAAGLFHTAFRLPCRSDLARWLAFAIDRKVPLKGASDHLVSEAIYLADPEGNGIEVYVDRPPAQWRDARGALRMATEPLDPGALLATAEGAPWSRFPEEGAIGHIHLQVGDTKAAEHFWDWLGFSVTSRYPGASFFGSGGYHHQLAANSWTSRGAGPRPADMAGLEGFELVVRDAAERAAIAARAAGNGIALSSRGGATTFRDPWGAAITLTD